MTPSPDLHQLAGIDTRPHPTVSVYLALDQGRDARLAALSQLCKAEEQLTGGNGRSAQWSLAAPDLERITRYVEEMPQGPERGLAVFACQPAGLFTAHSLPVVVPNLLELGPTPYIRPLAALAGDHSPSLAVLLDRKRARFFEGRLGQLAERRDLELALESPAGERDGDRGRAGDKRAVRNGEAASRFYREVAGALLDLFSRGGFQELYLGGARGAVEGLTQALHPYLAERLGGEFALEAGAPAAEVAAQVARLQPAARRGRQERLLARLSDNLGPGGQAATGLNQVLAALHRGQVHTLFVRRGYTAAGGSCPDCGRLRHVDGECPLCGQEMTPVADVVNLALAQALASGASLEQIEGASPLDELEGIAALLRYA
jgi:peptide chain release factor subunit 1